MAGYAVRRVTALAGGVGAARLLRGVAPLVPARDFAIVVNTADDEEFYGLHVSPDLDTRSKPGRVAPVSAAGASTAIRRARSERCGASIV